MNCETDFRYMARALKLAARGLYTTDPNPRVGCVVVKDGRVVGEGWHRRAGGPHAEIMALREAGDMARGGDCYVTLEPCCHHGRTPPCSDALIRAGIRRVVAAMSDPNPQVAGKGLEQLRMAGIETECGILASESAALNRGFCRRMRDGRPWVTSKMAATVDGRTALASGESRWITSPDSRRDVHRLRARSSAIVTGIGTVLADDPNLNARLDTDEEVLQPLRVVVDSTLRMPLRARMLSLPGRTLVVTVCEKQDRWRRLEALGAEVWLAENDHGRVDLFSLMSELARREINEVWVEAGPALNGSLAQRQLVDEWLLYLAPCLLGNDARGLFQLSGRKSMADRIELQFQQIRVVGPDLRIHFKQKH